LFFRTDVLASMFGGVLLPHSFLSTWYCISLYTLGTMYHLSLGVGKNVLLSCYTYCKLLVCNWPHSDWTKSLVCKDAFQQGFRYSEVFQRFCTVCKLRKIGSLPAVQTTCHPLQTLVNKNLVSFIFCIILLTHCAHTLVFILEVNFYFSLLHTLVKIRSPIIFTVHNYYQEGRYGSERMKPFTP
jgi:hypothetical protein